MGLSTRKRSMCALCWAKAVQLVKHLTSKLIGLANRTAGSSCFSFLVLCQLHKISIYLLVKDTWSIAIVKPHIHIRYVLCVNVIVQIYVPDMFFFKAVFKEYYLGWKTKQKAMLRALSVIFILPFVQIFTDEWRHPMENRETSVVK